MATRNHACTQRPPLHFGCRSENAPHATAQAAQSLLPRPPACRIRRGDGGASTAQKFVVSMRMQAPSLKPRAAS